jgi:hypothetical protein
MNSLLRTARQAAWQHDNMTLPARWWAAARAAHNHIAYQWRYGWLVLPHTIRLQELTYE